MVALGTLLASRHQCHCWYLLYRPCLLIVVTLIWLIVSCLQHVWCWGTILSTEGIYVMIHWNDWAGLSPPQLVYDPSNLFCWYRARGSFIICFPHRDHIHCAVCLGISNTSCNRLQITDYIILHAFIPNHSSIVLCTNLCVVLLCLHVLAECQRLPGQFGWIFFNWLCPCMWVPA